MVQARPEVRAVRMKAAFPLNPLKRSPYRNRGEIALSGIPDKRILAVSRLTGGQRWRKLRS
jgi:hypothetical protein